QDGAPRPHAGLSRRERDDPRHPAAARQRRTSDHRPQVRNFEFYMEVKPDWGNDSGFFFRTTESGAAYQITLDYLPGGSMGRLISEGGIQFGAGRANTPPAAAAGA